MTVETLGHRSIFQRADILMHLMRWDETLVYPLLDRGILYADSAHMKMEWMRVIYPTGTGKGTLLQLEEQKETIISCSGHGYKKDIAKRYRFAITFTSAFPIPGLVRKH